ncbi:MAG: hypothetical protein R3C31_00780 [Hyphomonadaceae bacterium]
MTEELFRDYWWLMFPIFGMGMGLWGMVSSERRSRDVMNVIRSYVEQGKEVPPELLRMAQSDWEPALHAPRSPRNSNLWSFFTFAALSAGFTVGWWYIRGEQWSFAFLVVAVTMGVLALGALIITIASRRS